MKITKWEMYTNADGCENPGYEQIDALSYEERQAKLLSEGWEPFTNIHFKRPCGFIEVEEKIVKAKDRDTGLKNAYESENIAIETTFNLNEIKKTNIKETEEYQRELS